MAPFLLSLAASALGTGTSETLRDQDGLHTGTSTERSRVARSEGLGLAGFISMVSSKEQAFVEIQTHSAGISFPFWAQDAALFPEQLSALLSCGSATGSADVPLTAPSRTPVSSILSHSRWVIPTHVSLGALSASSSVPLTLVTDNISAQAGRCRWQVAVGPVSSTHRTESGHSLPLLVHLPSTSTSYSGQEEMGGLSLKQSFDPWRNAAVSENDLWNQRTKPGTVHLLLPLCDSSVASSNLPRKPGRPRLRPVQGDPQACQSRTETRLAT